MRKKASDEAGDEATVVKSCHEHKARVSEAGDEYTSFFWYPAMCFSSLRSGPGCIPIGSRCYPNGY